MVVKRPQPNTVSPFPPPAGSLLLQGRSCVSWLRAQGCSTVVKVLTSLSRSFLTVSAATGDNSSWSYRLQDEVSLLIRLKSLSLFQGWLPDPAVLEDHQSSFVAHTQPRLTLEPATLWVYKIQICGQFKNISFLFFVLVPRLNYSRTVSCSVTLWGGQKGGMQEGRQDLIYPKPALHSQVGGMTLNF